MEDACLQPTNLNAVAGPQTELWWTSVTRNDGEVEDEPCAGGSDDCWQRK